MHTGGGLPCTLGVVLPFTLGVTLPFTLAVVLSFTLALSKAVPQTNSIWKLDCRFHIVLHRMACNGFKQLGTMP